MAVGYRQALRDLGGRGEDAGLRIQRETHQAARGKKPTKASELSRNPLRLSHNLKVVRSRSPLRGGR